MPWPDRPSPQPTEGLRPSRSAGDRQPCGWPTLLAAVREPIDVRIVSQIVFCASVAISPAMGGENFTGRDAAYIDWGVKNCSAVSTDKEHAMVDKANAKNGNAFLEQYQNESNKLAAASATPRKQEDICADIKEWYGSLGSRIADLLRWSQEKPSSNKAESPKENNTPRRKGRSAN
jgi:hypothetical protein